MISISMYLQNSIKASMSSMNTLQFLAKDAYDAYWDTDATTLITAAGASDQVLIDPAISKTTYVNGVTLVENIWKLFSNQAVSATDHLSYANNIHYGQYYASPIGAELSPAVAEVGEKIKYAADLCITLLEQSRTIQNMYNDNEMSDIVAVLDAERMISGSDMTRNDLANAVTLLQQFENFMTAATVTTGDYSVIVSKWGLY